MITVIRERRKAEQLTQAAAAVRLGIQRSYLGHIETRLKSPHLSIALRLGRLLSRSVEELFDETGLAAPADAGEVSRG